MKRFDYFYGHVLNKRCIKVTRVSLEVGTEGILGGQAVVADVEGTWKVSPSSVNNATS